MNSARRDGTHRNLVISWKLAALCLYFVSLSHCYFNLQEKMLSERQVNVYFRCVAHTFQMQYERTSRNSKCVHRTIYYIF